jgi:hypothetical protein
LILCFNYALGHSTRGSVTYAGIDVATGEMVTVIEWSFKLKSKNDKNMTFCDTDSKSSSDLMKQVIILQSCFFRWIVMVLCLSVNMHVSNC